MRRAGDKYGNATRVHTCLDFNVYGASCIGLKSPNVRISKKLNWMIAYFAVNASRTRVHKLLHNSDQAV